MRIFAFVDAQKADFPVRTLCRVCKVSVSGFYAWAARPGRRTRTGRGGPGRRSPAHIARVHAASRRRYGSPRVTAQLAREGITVNHKAVEREMARQGLAGRCSRRKIRTTRRDPLPEPRRLIWCAATSPGRVPMSCGSATRLTSGLMRAGVISRPWSTRARGGCSAGRSPATSARSYAWTRCWPRSRPAVGGGTWLPGSFFTPITARKADSTGRRNTSITEVRDGTRQEAVAGAAGGCTSAVGSGSGVASTDAFTWPA